MSSATIGAKRARTRENGHGFWRCRAMGPPWPVWRATGLSPVQEELNPTIFAVSTGQGKAGVAVIRISGAATEAVLEALTGRKFQPRHATRVWLRHPRTGHMLDDGLALWFPEGRSFTGEPVAELHIHGSVAVQKAVLGALAEMPGVQHAAAGEFTMRALRNGKLDLVQAEALADLLSAETEQQRRQAMAGFEGSLSRKIHRWSDQLLEIRAWLAADIDFADQEDASALDLGEIKRMMAELCASMKDVGGLAERTRLVNEGIRVALTGPPNVGKSSLLNALAGRDIAIVTPVAGTTRDVIETRLDIAGAYVRLFDTAGLRETADAIEQIGIARARETIGRADLVLMLSDRDPVGIEADAAGVAVQPDHAARVLHVRTKGDLLPADAALRDQALVVSATTGEGLEKLLAAMSRHIEELLAQDTITSEGVGVNERHVAAINRAVIHLQNGMALAESGVELVDEHVRLAAREMAYLLGSANTEEVLGAIFGRFCIGK